MSSMMSRVLAPAARAALARPPAAHRLPPHLLGPCTSSSTSISSSSSSSSPVAVVSSRLASSLSASRFRPRTGPIVLTTKGALGQRRHLTDEARAAIQTAVRTAPVVLFMKGTPEFPQCGFSRATIQILGQQGLDPAHFAAFNVLENAELRQGIKEFSDWPTIPQLYVDGEFIGGCDIVVSMHKNGDLTALLEEKKVLLPVQEEDPTTNKPDGPAVTKE